MHAKLLLKLLYAMPGRVVSFARRYSGTCQITFACLIILGIYSTTTYYPSKNDKLPSIVEIFNDTGFTETPEAISIETSNVLRNQQAINVAERRALLNETVSAFSAIQIQEILENCGLPKPCGKDEFSVHVYTGRDNTDEPRLCIDGKYVISKDVNGGGRGINVAVIDNLTRTIIRVGHYDTYEKESVVLETLLLTLRPGDILIILTFDEPSKKLSRFAKLLLYDLGSALVQNLGYRGSWYFVTQKGMAGFSPFEELHLMESSGWPLHHDVRFCIPFKMKGISVHPDPPPSSNPERVHFCELHENLPLFCDADVVNDALSPAPAWKQPAAVNKIYRVPILVMSGENTEYLPLTLETLVRQPGIRPSMVVVFHLSNNVMAQNVSDLFGFAHEDLPDNLNHCERLADAFSIMTLLYSNAKEVLVIGENAILAPDFLFYFGQLLSIFAMDSSLLSISALNENGFKSLSGDPTKVYRVGSFSGLAFLVRTNFFQSSLCEKRYDIDPFYISTLVKGVSLVPDVSRVTLAVPSSYNGSLDVASHFLNYDRTITYEQNIILKGPEKLFEEQYEAELKSLLVSSEFFKFGETLLKLCLTEPRKFQKELENYRRHLHNTVVSPGKLISIPFHQEHVEDVRVLHHLTKCFGLFHHSQFTARGLYKGSIWFTLRDHPCVLVGSESPFFSMLPKGGRRVISYDGRLSYSTP